MDIFIELRGQYQGRFTVAEGPRNGYKGNIRHFRYYEAQLVCFWTTLYTGEGYANFSYVQFDNMLFLELSKRRNHETCQAPPVPIRALRCR